MTDDLKALISFAPAIMGPGFFVPIRRGIPAFDRILTEKTLMSPRTIVD
jgi:hypothetical protein